MKMPSEELLGKIVTQCKSWVEASDAKLGERARAWEDAEKMNQSYLPKADAERRAKASQEEQSFTKIVIPYAYAMQMAAHTYLCSVFLSRDPVFQYEGKTGQGQDQTTMVEALIKHNVTSGDLTPALFFALYDLCQYGVCCVGSMWADEKIAITMYGSEPLVVNGVADPENMTETETILEEQGYKGNKLYNVKPKELIVDPSVGFARFQDGDFFGRRVQISQEDFERKVAEGIYFDVDVPAAQDKDPGVYGDNPALSETTGKVSLEIPVRKDFYNLWEIYARIVPANWGLGKNTRPEVWVFTIASGKVCVGANPAGYLHAKYPFDIGTLEFDGYTLSSRGYPEIGGPINGVMNWLINSHMYNVSKAVNNEFLYDPSVVNQADFLDPRPGKRIRIKPAGYGRDVRTFIHQFNQYDMTRTNLQDLQFMEEIFQRVFGINEQMLGVMGGGGRKTATEVRSSSGFALNRMKVLTEFVSAQFFAPLSKKLLKNALQLYTQEDKFIITKDKTVQPYTVADIVGDFDFAPADGSLPVDRFAQVALYKEVLMATQQLPQIAGRYDVATLFSFICKLAGIKNMESFEIMDTAQVQKEAMLGNLVVNGGQNVAGNAGIVGGPEGSSGAAPAVSGVGNTA
ncbi:MAG: head to tail joining protein [Siphoviridae sp. ct7UA22]|nr:MAG: head to tail joining protein [Siphoviridae sp. ct7UA22]